MTKEEYQNKKNEQRKIWLSKVFAHAGDVDSDILLEEALTKFENEYPKYENIS